MDAHCRQIGWQWQASRLIQSDVISNFCIVFLSLGYLYIVLVSPEACWDHLARKQCSICSANILDISPCLLRRQWSVLSVSNSNIIFTVVYWTLTLSILPSWPSVFPSIRPRSILWYIASRKYCSPWKNQLFQ